MKKSELKKLISECIEESVMHIDKDSLELFIQKKKKQMHWKHDADFFKMLKRYGYYGDGYISKMRKQDVERLAYRMKNDYYWKNQG